MGKQEKQTSGIAEDQVFELTMDNTEDQDVLNRQLRKPGESDRCPTAQVAHPSPGTPATESTEKKTGI
jgi:hypothetical protein